MTLASVTRVTDDLWSPALAAIQATALDCLQANLAAVADQTRPGVHLTLGAPLGFTLNGELSVATSLDDRLAEAAELLGLQVNARWDGLDGAGLRALAAERSPLYVVADAYSMAWVPYASHRHLEHSFLLVRAGPGEALIADAYHNNTEWGEASPGLWQITPAELDAAAEGATALMLNPGQPPELDADAICVRNAAAMDAAGADIERYVAAARSVASDHQMLERLVLDVWLLSRSRQLHAAWLASLGDRPGEAAAAGQHAQAWLRLSTLAFVAERRARRGQPASSTLADQLEALLHEDVLLARRLGRRTSAARTVVLDELKAITGLNVESLDAGTELRTLPGFSSFRLVDLIERAEKRLGVELDPDDLSPDSLRTIASVCELFAGAAARTPGRADSSGAAP